MASANVFISRIRNTTDKNQWQHLVIAASNHIAETGQGPVNDSQFQILFFISLE